MKLSDNLRHISPERLSALAAIWFVVSVMLPNIMLAATENYGFWTAACNLVLPSGIYLLWVTAVRRGGVMVLWGFIFIFFAAFQIVLLSLFGNSIIGADMFTNLLTTNPGEASELLANISGSVAIVFALFLPLVALSIFIVVKRYRYGGTFRRRMRRYGAAATVAGVVLLVAAYLFDGGNVLRDKIFPVNVSYNLGLGFKELVNVKRYGATSRGFSYHAHRTGRSDGREVYVFVIGEASRACSWQLYGYGRETTPRLARRSDICLFRNVVTQSNTTHKSVPMILSSVATDRHDELYCRTGMPALFNEAGFDTWFVSNQAPQGAMIDNLAEGADHVEYLSDDYDMSLVERTRAIMRDNPERDLFIILHCYGSHFCYHQRYPREFACFTPDDNVSISEQNAQLLLNAYDNSILYTDHVLASLIETVEADGSCAAILYCSDHGEDLLDDSRRRFLHASPTVTYYQLHVAAFAWFSDKYRELWPERIDAAAANTAAPATTRAMFHTIADMAAVQSPYVDAAASLTSSDFDRDAPRFYLDDHNRAEAFGSAIGLTEDDMAMFRKMGIERL